MARPSTVTDDELIARLAGVFRNVGYEGASLAMLSQASGLQRASLYHRYPGGKQQMAEAVIEASVGWTVDHVIKPLRGSGDVRKRWSVARRALEDLYGGGHKSCLLNMLMAPRNAGGPFDDAILSALKALIDAFAVLARDAGAPEDRALALGQSAVTLIQGSLVLARGLRDAKPFEDALASIEAQLLTPQ